MQYEEINLEDISILEVQSMVESLLKTKSIPFDLRRFIQAKGEGNPFYIEELINSLVDLGTLLLDNREWKLTKPFYETDVPSTIQGLISARLDRLGPEEKGILQEASVVGRVFPHEILKRVTKIKDQVDVCLRGLEKHDLIRIRSYQPEFEYVFKHAFTHDVAYNSLLKKKRQALHERIGLVMEQLFKNRLPEHYETLAFHFTQGLSLSKAVDYLIKSGDKSIARYAIDESYKYYKEAFDFLSSKKDKFEADHKSLMYILLKWVHVYHCLGDYSGLMALLKCHESFAETLDDKELLGMFYCWFGFAFNRREKLLEAQAYLKKALAIGEEIKSTKIIGYASAFLTFNSSDLGLLEEAIVFGERAQEMVSFNEDVDMFRIAHASSCYAFWFRGEGKKCGQLARRLLDYGKRRFELRCQAQGYFFSGIANVLLGDYGSAIDCCQMGVEVCPDPVFAIHAKSGLMVCYAAAGRFKECLNTLKELISFGKEHGVETVGTIMSGFYGIILLSEGNLKEGIIITENAIKTCLENGSRWRQATLYHVLGKAYLQIVQGGGHKGFSFFARNLGFLITTVPVASQKAAQNLNKAIEISSGIGALNILGQAYLDLCQLHKVKGRISKALDCVSLAIDAFEKCEADIFLKKAKETLAALK